MYIAAACVWIGNINCAFIPMPSIINTLILTRLYYFICSLESCTYTTPLPRVSLSLHACLLHLIIDNQKKDWTENQEIKMFQSLGGVL